MKTTRYRSVADLPTEVRVFPLSGALLLPRGVLPLNIFEPRYLAMVDAAMAGDRLIGMIQPTPGAPGHHPDLSAVGCAGRITSYAETEDGRYLINLKGIARFRVVSEGGMKALFRHVQADFTPFAADLAAEEPGEGIDRAALTAALRRYVDANGYRVEWSAVEEAPIEGLILTIAALCPFDPVEKQGLLEAPTLAERAVALTAMLEFNAAGRPEGSTLQ
jgi:Lon protease-like protein